MFKPLKWVENNLFYSSHPSRATFNFPSTAGLLGHLYHYQISTRSLVSFLHWQGVSPCGKQVCHHAAAGQGKPREKQASQDHLRAQHHNSCFHVWFPNALKSELKRKQSCHVALFWHCYESAATWKLYIYCRDLFYVEKKKKHCGNWECIDLHFVGLFLCSSLSIYFWLWEETGYWVRWSDPASQSDVLTINSSKTARGFMKIASSWGMVELKTHWLHCRLDRIKSWHARGCLTLLALFCLPAQERCSSMSLQPQLIPVTISQQSLLLLLVSHPDFSSKKLMLSSQTKLPVFTQPFLLLFSSSTWSRGCKCFLTAFNRLLPHQQRSPKSLILFTGVY